MAQPGPSGVQKRTIQMVDPDDTSSKKIRAEPKQERRLKCLNFIVFAYKKILASITRINPVNDDIMVGCQITNVIFSAYTINRQRAAGLIGNTEKQASAKKEYTFSRLGAKISLKTEDVVKMIDDAAKESGLKFTSPKDPDSEWYGTAAPYLNFFLAFQLRMNELRTGHGTMPIKKENGIAKAFPVSKYGFFGSHHILLEGCTFPPEMRRVMAHSLGPATTLLCYLKSEARFKQKWMIVAKRALAHVPHIDVILELIYNKPAAEIRALLKEVADILLLITSRQAQRMCMSLCMFTNAYDSCAADEDAVMADKTGSTSTATSSLITPEPAPTSRYDQTMPHRPHKEEFLKKFTISGPGAFFAYKLACTRKYKLQGIFSESVAAQIVYHSTFGTYKEDLSLLEWATSEKKWATRKDIGADFQKMTTCGEVRTFTPITNLKYSKLAAGSQTSLLASNFQQICTAPCFSGRRKQKFVSEFFKQLGKQQGTVTIGGSIVQLTAALHQTVEYLKQHVLENTGKLEIGVTEWRDAVAMTLDGGAELDETPEYSGKMFLGRR